MNVISTSVERKMANIVKVIFSFFLFQGDEHVTNSHMPGLLVIAISIISFMKNIRERDHEMREEITDPMRCRHTSPTRHGDQSGLPGFRNILPSKNKQFRYWKRGMHSTSGPQCLPGKQVCCPSHTFHFPLHNH